MNNFSSLKLFLFLSLCFSTRAIAEIPPLYKDDKVWLKSFAIELRSQLVQARSSGSNEEQINSFVASSDALIRNQVLPILYSKLAHLKIIEGIRVQFAKDNDIQEDAALQKSYVDKQLRFLLKHFLKTGILSWNHSKSFEQNLEQSGLKLAYDKEGNSYPLADAQKISALINSVKRSLRQKIKEEYQNNFEAFYNDINKDISKILQYLPLIKSIS